MGRPPCCDKSNVKRGLWTPEEDKKILAYVSTHGAGNWASVPKKAGLKRCGKSCRLRWTNYLRPDLKHDEFTAEEEEMIIAIHAEIGSRWSVIAGQLPGRTDNDVKNYWNTKLKKKLIELGIDPVTHKPISHVINSIHCLSGGSSGGGVVTSNAAVPARKDVPNAKSHTQKDPRVSCLSRDLRNVLMASMQQESPLGSSQLDAAASMGGRSSTTPLQRTVGYDYDSMPYCGLLTQLHAVNKLVADASKVMAITPSSPPPQPTPNYQPASASCSSSFGLSLAQTQKDAAALAGTTDAEHVPPDYFSWTDFIIHGLCPLLTHGEQPQSKSHGAVTTTKSVSDEIAPPPQENLHIGSGDDDGLSWTAAPTKETKMNDHSASCETGDQDMACMASPGSGPYVSDIGSFVESLLNRDEEMTWEFPEFLEDNPFARP